MRAQRTEGPQHHRLHADAGGAHTDLLHPLAARRMIGFSVAAAPALSGAPPISPPSLPPSIDALCGHGQWQLSASGQDCDAACAAGGGSCVALPAAVRGLAGSAVAEACLQGLAEAFETTCDSFQVGYDESCATRADHPVKPHINQVLVLHDNISIVVPML